jgi:hypothetical protein
LKIGSTAIETKAALDKELGNLAPRNQDNVDYVNQVRRVVGTPKGRRIEELTLKGKLIKPANNSPAFYAKPSRAEAGK